MEDRLNYLENKMKVSRKTWKHNLNFSVRT